MGLVAGKSLAQSRAEQKRAKGSEQTRVQGAAIRAVLDSIGSFARPTSATDATPIAWPGQEKIAERAGCSVRTVQKYVPIAEKAGWLKTKLVKDSDGDKYSHLKYWLLIPPELDAQHTGSLADEGKTPKPTAPRAKPPAPDDKTARTAGQNHLHELRTSSSLKDLMKTLRTPDARTNVPFSQGEKSKTQEQEASREDWIKTVSAILKTSALEDLIRESVRVNGLEACQKIWRDPANATGNWLSAEEFAAALREMPTAPGP